MADRTQDRNDPGYFAERRFAVAVDRLCEEFHGVFAAEALSGACASASRCSVHAGHAAPHDRALGQQSVESTLAHTDQASKDFMRELPFDLRFAVGDHAVHLVHGSPRTVNEYLFEDKPARPVRASRRGRERRCRRRPARRLRDPHSGTESVEVTIERVTYDAAAVADEVRRAGLPGEFADKLALAT